MYGILVSAANFLLGWIFRGVVIKFVILGALYYVVTWIAESVLTQIDISSLDGLQSVVNSLPAAMLWFMSITNMGLVIPIILGAMLARFMIRRLPIIG